MDSACKNVQRQMKQPTVEGNGVMGQFYSCDQIHALHPVVWRFAHYGSYCTVRSYHRVLQLHTPSWIVREEMGPRGVFHNHRYFESNAEMTGSS